MTTRRGFLAGLLASGIASNATWADVGSPRFLTAARVGEQYRLYGLTAQGAEVFSLNMPGRGHAAAAHPEKAEVVAFARRPGRFAQVIDCSNGAVKAELHSPEARHFYGHGVFSSDGRYMLTPENDYENGRGLIGVWDRAQGYKRVGEFASGGVGPHDMLRLPGTDKFVVANGGIDTHPESGRTALNLPTMRANLALVGLDGTLHEITELDAKLRLNSIRHMALRPDGLVGFAMQWQGNPTDHPPLVGLYRPGSGIPPILGQAPEDLHHRMKGYAGSIAFSGDGTQIAISSPRGGMIQVFDAETGEFAWHIEEPDVCGLNVANNGFLATAGTGRIVRFSSPEAHLLRQDKAAWDNHLVTI
ncbi:hypothetical protein SAMN06265173_13220 [Thalassovita litoralis]|uniref:Twin-arginine translocation pathway signal n=1 Tax=Thalassovita litoralis TaxID=1010611 RepID=A0A521FJV8_9RHOB|nr:DUF1513 domain-containing protein [Thalassovita litoralis]SMO96406.1 hypothetical protein SAMN06265173_13220 [Thalassovita litoralis]